MAIDYPPGGRWAATMFVAAALGIFALLGSYFVPELVARWGGLAFAVPAILIWLGALAVPPMLFASGRKRAAAVTALGIAVGCRAALVWTIDGRVPSGDAEVYRQLAQGLRDGRGYHLFDTYMGVETWALYPPLYPAMLAAWTALFGVSSVAVAALNAVIDAGAAALIVGLARALGRPRAGLLAAWLYVQWPSTLLSAPLAQKEGLCALLVLALALLWVRMSAAARPGVRAAAAIGGVAGLLALTQPGELPIAALFGLVAIGVAAAEGGVPRRMMVLAASVMPAAAVAVLMPWWVRNALVLHQFVPLTSAGGYGLWIGNNPGATGRWMPPPQALHGLPEVAFGRAAGALAFGWIADHPIDAVALTARKIVRAWSIAEFGAERLRNMRPSVDRTATGGLALGSQFAHVAMLASGALGAVAATIRRTPGARTLLLLVLACIVQTLVFGSPFEFAERHRDFATPFLLLLGVWGVGCDPKTQIRLP